MLQELKGAAWATITAFAQRPDFTAALWGRLLKEGVFLQPGSDSTLTVPVPNYDMTYQLNEIEVRFLERQTCTLCVEYVEHVMICSSEVVWVL